MYVDFIARNVQAPAVGSLIISKVPTYPPPTRGRHGGMDQNRGGTTSFWAIVLRDEPGLHSTLTNFQSPQDPIDGGLVLGESLFLHNATSSTPINY